MLRTAQGPSFPVPRNGLLAHLLFVGPEKQPLISIHRFYRTLPLHSFVGAQFDGFEFERIDNQPREADALLKCELLPFVQFRTATANGDSPLSLELHSLPLLAAMRSRLSSSVPRARPKCSRRPGKKTRAFRNYASRGFPKTYPCLTLAVYGPNSFENPGRTSVMVPSLCFWSIDRHVD